MAPNIALLTDEEISKCRENVWSAVQAMEHRLLQVFTKDEHGEDLIFIGRLKVTPKGHSDIQVGFAIHALVDRSSRASGRSKFELVQVFQVSKRIGKTTRFQYSDNCHLGRE